MIRFLLAFTFVSASLFSAENHSSNNAVPIPSSVVEEQLKAHIKYNQQGSNVIGHLLIGGKTTEINDSTWLYIKTGLDYYKKIKPAFIILELNTPGGEVFAAEKISDALIELDTQYGIPVVAFINNWAISAGSMLAYSCRFISVVKDASMGAAEPLMQSEAGKLEAASEKVKSALRADFANRASFFDRNPDLAQAMVDKDLLLVIRNEKIVKLDNENQILSTDTILSSKGKLLTLNSKQLIDLGVADIYLPPTKLNPITPEELTQGVWSASKELLFEYPFFASIPNAVINAYKIDWKTQFFMYLSNPIISSFLLLGFMISMYVEITTGGFGLAATVALTCLFLIILSSFALEIANWLEVILLLTGLAILLVEIFILPTFGLLGFIGIILFLAGLFGLMLPGLSSMSFDFDTQSFNAAGEAAISHFIWICGTFLLGLLIILLMTQYFFPKIGLFKRFVLSGHEQDASLGYIAGETPEKLPKQGEKGEVIATLRPAGKVLIHDTVYDAISAGNFIEKGTKIVVVRIEGSVVIVNEEHLT